HRQLLLLRVCSVSRCPPSATVFPYTTLFRSPHRGNGRAQRGARAGATAHRKRALRGSSNHTRVPPRRSTPHRLATRSSRYKPYPRPSWVGSRRLGVNPFPPSVTAM